MCIRDSNRTSLNWVDLLAFGWVIWIAVFLTEPLLPWTHLLTDWSVISFLHSAFLVRHYVLTVLAIFVTFLEARVRHLWTFLPAVGFRADLHRHNWFTVHLAWLVSTLIVVRLVVHYRIVGIIGVIRIIRVIGVVRVVWLLNKTSGIWCHHFTSFLE